MTLIDTDMTRKTDHDLAYSSRTVVNKPLPVVLGLRLKIVSNLICWIYWVSYELQAPNMDINLRSEIIRREDRNA